MVKKNLGIALTSIPASSTTDHDSTDDWFPPTNAQRQQHERSKIENNKKKNREWTIKRFTKCVGYGKHCYRIVQDCVLNWEFHNNLQDQITVQNNENDVRINHNQLIIPKKKVLMVY